MSAVIAVPRRNARSTKKHGLSALLTLSILCAASPGIAQSAANSAPLAEVTWPEEARKVNWVDYSLIGVGATTAILSRALGPRSGGPSGGVLFDDGVRSGLRADTAHGRHVAGTVSDALLISAAAYGQIVDPLVNTWALRQSPDAAWQLFWINSEVMALTFGVQQLTSNLVGRERPFGSDCDRTDLSEKEQEECANDDRYRSFFSGHTSVPFSIATATCIHHYKLGLSGRVPALTCGLGFALAATSGALRIVADKHYATDVATGLVIGTAIGALIPLWHYGFGSTDEEDSAPSGSAAPSSAQAPPGLTMTPRAPVRLAIFPLVERHAGREYFGLNLAGALP